MARKYSFKLIFLKCILEFMINTVPPASNIVYGREKCLECKNFTHSINQWQCRPVRFQSRLLLQKGVIVKVRI